MTVPTSQSKEISRRPIRVRGASWAGAMARGFTHAGIRPNTISVASVLFSAIGAIGLILSTHVESNTAVVLLASTPIWIALRSLFNMLDGMVAVEGGKATPSGAVFNEFPDRVSDILLLVGAGYAAQELAWSVQTGWAVAVLAVTVAYVRALGASNGLGQDFTGPMAKPMRMAVLSLGCFAGAIELGMNQTRWSLLVTLVIIGVGCVLTIAKRLTRAVRQLEAGA